MNRFSGETSIGPNRSKSWAAYSDRTAFIAIFIFWAYGTLAARPEFLVMKTEIQARERDRTVVVMALVLATILVPAALSLAFYLSTI